jgi:hypothetical protein
MFVGFNHVYLKAYFRFNRDYSPRSSLDDLQALYALKRRLHVDPGAIHMHPWALIGPTIWVAEPTLPFQLSITYRYVFDSKEFLLAG